jgi:hypothetical protein
VGAVREPPLREPTVRESTVPGPTDRVGAVREPPLREPTTPEPPLEDTLEAIADMLERTLAPAGGGNPAAGRAIIQRLAALSQAQFEQSAAAHSTDRRTRT